MADVFVSYARADLERVLPLVTALEDAGIDLFWDREMVPVGQFRRRIRRELEKARCLIVVWSQSSVDSDWVIDEAQEGIDDNRLVSSVIDGVQPPLGFRQYQFADLSEWDGAAEHPEFEKLVEAVKFVLTGADSSPVLPPRPKPTVRPGPEPQPKPQPPQPKPAIPPAGPPKAREPGRRFAFVAPTLLLLAVFLANLIQTAADPHMTPASLGAEAGYPLVEAFRWIEGQLSFDAHDATNPVAVRSYSTAYFFLFPLLCAGVAIALARRRDPRPFRAFSLAVAINYVVGLPFFWLFPVPERWAFPESEAMLLSDKWSESLIEAFRPMSGLDNCFPSFHTSLTVVAITSAYLFGLRLRTTILALGGTVVFATFALGIHWLPDILAGFALGVISVGVAWRMVRTERWPWLWDWSSLTQRA